MPITPDMLARARQHKRAESEQLLALMYPPLFRMAHALLGQPIPAARAITQIMRRALTRVEHWRDDADAQRWFLHFTILEVRQTSPPTPPDPAADLLLIYGPPNHIPYSAFIRALRSLPPQQRESIILHHAAHLNDRYVAIAMDCSTAAAHAHLVAAEATLTSVVGPSLPERFSELSAAYRALGPAPEVTPREVRTLVTRDLRARTTRKWLRAGMIFLLLTIIGVGIGYWAM